jgi:hypothetical protein
MTKLLPIIFLSLTFISYKQRTKQLDKDKHRIDSVCETFMKLFTESKPHDALQLLKQNTILASSAIDTLQAEIDNQMNYYFPQFGKMISYDFIVERKIKDFVAKRFYVLRFEKYFLKFEFTLYKATTGWTITHFKFDEEMVELLY